MNNSHFINGFSGRSVMRSLTAGITCLLFTLFQCVSAADELQTAQEHLQKGRYEEALAAYEALQSSPVDPVQVQMGLSNVYEQLGRWDNAREQMEVAVKQHSQNALLRARLAEIHFRQGRYAECEKVVREALKLDPQQPLAMWVQAELFTETGRLKEAAENHVWFVRYYNRVQPHDAETLLLIARGATQYARWKNSRQIFSFTINTLCPDALKNNPHCWQAYWISGSLLLEKYNRSQGLPELESALAINPQAAPVLAEIGLAHYDQNNEEQAEEFADRALRINPNLLAALWLKADLRLDAGQWDEALKLLERAKQVNPVEQRTLARIAACYLLLDGPPPEDQLDAAFTHLENISQFQPKDPGRVMKLIIEVAQRNPHPGPFLFQLGYTVEARRQYALAEKLYRQTMKTMPQLSEPKNNLGMLYLRIGKHKDAQKILDEAFKADPYHVRVYNMRKVLTVLEGYEVITTEHFVIHVDSQLDRVLGEYMAEYLEEIYPELTQALGYEPQQRTHFEIYNTAKGVSGHEWFSSRMVGLPWIQTVGASTGVIVALTSPAAAAEPFNWARVLRHEFVHVITLQQTGFNIPHWFTEALAVTYEGSREPEEWNELLLERVPKGDLRDLSNLSEGFTRPKSAEDWQFAYCQSRLYARYMQEQFGPESIPEMLDAYRRNLSTEQAIKDVFSLSLKEFESGYRSFLQEIVKELKSGSDEKLGSTEELQRAYGDNPDDPDAIAGYAYLQLSQRQFNSAREYAMEARDAEPNHPLASFVLATLALRGEDSERAKHLLREGLDRNDPSARVLSLLARLHLLDEEYKAAEELYQLGNRFWPHNSDWLRGLAVVYIESEQNEPLKEVLKELSLRDADDYSIRKKLAELYLKEGNYQEAMSAARLALQINVLDAELHQILGRSYAELKTWPKAIREFEVALQLQPNEPESMLFLAESYLAANQPDKAREQLQQILKILPNHSRAKQLLNQIQ